jgi:hypothetical protein
LAREQVAEGAGTIRLKPEGDETPPSVAGKAHEGEGGSQEPQPLHHTWLSFTLTSALSSGKEQREVGKWGWSFIQLNLPLLLYSSKTCTLF